MHGCFTTLVISLYLMTIYALHVVKLVLYTVYRHQQTAEPEQMTHKIKSILLLNYL